MATKWKSSLLIIITCIILFTSGLVGLLFLSNYGFYYAHKDYFHTSEFKYGELDEFARYLGVFEINNLSLEEAKAAIIVTEEEIHEHRYRFGDLDEQILNIQNQYEDLIQQALVRNNQNVADAYIAERDEKIADITNNFESDNYVKAKIIKEKEQRLETYYSEIETYRSDFESYKETFQYYFRDRATGEIYTNLDISEEEASLQQISKDKMLFATNFTIYDDHMVNYEVIGSEDLSPIIHESDRTLEGKIGVPKSLSSTNQFMINYNNYKLEQIIFWSVISLSIIALILSFYIFKRAKQSRAEISQWKYYYNKLPIDVRVLFVGLSIIVTLMAMLYVTGHISYIGEDPIAYGVFLVIGLLIVSFGLALSLTQSVFLYATFKDWKNLAKEWNGSLLYKAYLFLKQVLCKLIQSLKEAFLDQTTGTQIIIVIGLIFALGFAAVITVVHPVFAIFYILLLGGVGIPIAMIIIDKIGYFNRIVENTNELAAGKLSKDLNVTGKSAFATLANNINLLKQGIRISQNEQAKSERLKTELITNVSHDLRTPLTSIITYTELLKEQQDIHEESAAYLEIIDRKSKRLKVLIDDLFEVSKMASGNMELKKEKVDLVQLLQQALAEYDDMIHDSSLQFRVSNGDSPVNALVDGQKLWRVFDNLIGNILKYSLENSRVYINLSTDNGKAIITFKNVSKYELSENSEELFERFKRGDTSRNTEGSGLGLAIAQSIIDLHDGSLEIDIDGDLFKVTISLWLQE